MAPRNRDGIETPSLRLPKYVPPPLPPFAQRALARSDEGAVASARTPEHPIRLAPGHSSAIPQAPPRNPDLFPSPHAVQVAITPTQPVTEPHACSDNHAHVHDHHHGHSACDHAHGILDGHTHDYSHLAVGAKNRSILRVALVIQALFLIVEVAGGFAFNSLALLSDAAHMLADVAAIALALAAAHLAQGRPKNADGHSRTEMVAASINGYALLIATAVIAFEGLRRLLDPPEVIAGGTMVIAILGLLANVATALVLMRADQGNVNIRATLAHTITDAISSVGVIAAAALIAVTGAHVLDPIVSLLLALVIGRMAWKITREAAAALKSWTP